MNRSYDRITRCVTAIMIKDRLKTIALKWYAGLCLAGFWFRQQTPFPRRIQRLNLCGAGTSIKGYFNLDIALSADLTIDLARFNIPMAPSTIDAVVCMSAINYFSYHRAAALIVDTYSVLKPGGIARFGVQDLEAIARRYVEKDHDFFFQKLPDGTERFEGRTLGDKFAAWFYGYTAGGTSCRYFYDFDALAALFSDAGFSIVERREFRDSRLEDIERIDNRPDQMFYLEAVK